MVNTCYVNALVQCLLVLDKLRLWMLGPDPPMGSIGMALKEIFMETRAGNDPKEMRKPKELLESVSALNSKYLREGLNAEEMLKRPSNIPEGVPTVVDSISQGPKFTTLTCKCCRTDSPSTHEPFYELALNLPQKEHPTKSVASSPRSIRLARWWQRIAAEQLPTIESNSEKDQTIVDSGNAHIPESESVAMEQAPKLLEVGEFIACSST
uniref:USP domain-containing protein n=1 Tax=Arundo donax TaxID=35708 RepID=A0A0A8Y5E7_ARUDO